MNHNSELGTWTPASEEIFFNHFPLHRACRDGDYEALGSLLSATGDRDFYLEDTFYGWTPIHWAAYFGKLPCLMKLLEHNANCDVPTERLNQTPIHVAAYGGYGYCVKWLLHCGARINRQDYMGETPIHKAARTGSMECVSLLVSQGAKLSIRNLSGNTPSQVAVLAGHQECGNYLEKALEIHQQTNVVHEEMRNHAANPVSSPSNISSSTDMSEVNEYAIRQSLYGNFIQQPFENDIIHENGKTLSSDSHTGPPKQYVSTDYQGTTIFVQNGVACIPNGVTPMLNGMVTENNNVLTSHDCDIEMEAEGAPVGQKCNGMSNGIHNGGYENGVASGGMKRCREDTDDGCIKRARSEGLNAIFQHKIGYSWQPVLLVEEEPERNPRKNHRPTRSYWQAFSYNYINRMLDSNLRRPKKIKFPLSVGLDSGGSNVNVINAFVMLSSTTIHQMRKTKSQWRSVVWRNRQYNNNIVSLYNAVLAISVQPMRTPTGRSQHQDGGHSNLHHHLYF